MISSSKFRLVSWQLVNLEAKYAKEADVRKLSAAVLSFEIVVSSKCLNPVVFFTDIRTGFPRWDREYRKGLGE